MKKIAFALIALALSALASPPALASQGSACMPTTGTVSGLTLVQDINAALKALLTSNSGGTAPVNDCSGLSQLGQIWLDTTANLVKWYDGTNWLTIGKIDATNHIWAPIIGGGTATLASATTPDLCSSTQAAITITGVTTITGFGPNCTPGTLKVVTFAGSLILTQNPTTFILPNNGSNITTAAGDTAIVQTTGPSTYRFVAYMKADGTPVSATNVTAQALTVAARSNTPINLGLTAGVASNVLSVFVTDSAGATPSPTSPVLIPFRDSTVTSGAPVWVSVTGALSINTNAVGATLGSTNGVPFRFWIVVFNNSGTPVLGLVNCSNANQVFPAISNEGALQTSVSMTAGSTSAGVIYTPNGTTVTTRAFRILGYLEYASGLTTAGTYATAPTSLMLFGPDVKKPGDIVQTLYASNSTPVVGAGSYAPSATLPTTSVSALAVTAPAFTGVSPMNILRIDGEVFGGSNSGNNGMAGFLWNGSSVLKVSAESIAAVATAAVSIPVKYQVLMPSSGGLPSTVTYSLYGVQQVGTGSVNAINGNSSSVFTGTPLSNITIQEIMGANDNEALGLPSLPKVA